MLAAFDFETRGLFGDIFRGGYYDEVNGYKNFYNAEEFFAHILEIESKLPEIVTQYRGKEKKIKDTLYLYAFNLEFDLSKILKEFKKKKKVLQIDYASSLIINGAFHTAKIVKKNIQFMDAYPLVGCSLDMAAKSFELKNKKIEICEDKDEYFKTIDKDAPDLLEYLKADVVSTYELVKKIQNLSNLPESIFVRCPTIASLSMKIFKTNMPNDFEEIKKSTLCKEQEEFVRNAYHGGRTEVFKNYGQNLYHYDVNSLYPSEMRDQFYPIGPAKFKDIPKDKDKNEYLLWSKDFCDKNNFLYIIDCKVFVPIGINIGLLPIKLDGKLVFPVGVFEGKWTSVELNYAISQGVKVLQIKSLLYWTKRKKVFSNFVEMFRKLKEESTGAKRHFAKSVQNSLSGKFAMQRERSANVLCEEEIENEFRAKDVTYITFFNKMEQRVITYKKLFFADYIRPQFSAFITAYARVKLLATMIEAEKNSAQIFYCDTDSIILNKKLPEIITHPTSFGFWKLEKEVVEGYYILPKLYAERTKDGETLKSKGIVKAFLQSINFDAYAEYFKKMIKNEDAILYDENSPEKYYTRPKIMQVEKGKKFDYDDKLLLKKRILFANSNIYKRVFNFANNSSTPIILKDLEE